MRLGQRPFDAGPINEGLTKPRRREARGWGPFTGGQLTIVIVAIAAMFAIPTAALAAGASFTSKSNGTPAVAGKNTASNGVGVSGKGKHYGVFSNGPLGVAAGKTLRCAACVTRPDLAAGAVGVGALSASAKVLQPLGSGESESGWIAGGGGTSASGSMLGGFTFPRPVTAYASVIVATGISDPTHCTGIGSAARGYLCAYSFNAFNATFAGLSILGATGGAASWGISGSGSFGEATYTVTAP